MRQDFSEGGVYARLTLEALGLNPAASSGSMPAVTDDDSGPTGKKKKKKKR